MKSMLAHFIGVVLLAGCVSVTGISPDYPAGWPPVSSTSHDVCPDLSGRYQNLAIYSFLPMYGANSLAFRLGGETRDTDTVVLAYSSDTLRVETLSGKVIVGEKRLSKDNGDFSCAEGAFVLPIMVDQDADGTGGYRAERRLYLRRARGGALIGEQRSSGVGAMFWLVPIGGWQTFWFQWHQAK
ncbi:hypothetical protein [Oceanisphaera arctica]|uniref:Lipoprotein n=1 Tax=Oceanisphaera arctica TaxID=641510 RepID=A0A2P5TQQ7_9GAMM|nr:hypothetical protein [Oceanisphaera arctica]PPL18096.1 hypothetical protein UN63_02760 [Oceanisphaera arctica]GHA09788.1 hypothetical protein GCM10007082_08510 [Oceanisphaera arctica]